ncbi:MAG: DUF4317 domain-containing protein [Lachnospiraceae bacterium]|nr:DUF4317 domain-containing protein [Lachnospiraceae bacterium]
MINRDDMLELTRRMTPSRTCFTRIAGCYLDEEGYVDGTFNTNFLKLNHHDKQYNLKIAKTIPFARTNDELIEYVFPGNNDDSKEMAMLLNSLNSVGLKNDEMMEIFYEQLAEKMDLRGQYAIYLFHGTYDIIMKSSDGARLEDSEEVYQFLICTIAPWEGDYVVGTPEYGFLYPSFKNRSEDPLHMAVFVKDEDLFGQNFVKHVLGVSE